jgi:hypothetical protein
MQACLTPHRPNASTVFDANCMEVQGAEHCSTPTSETCCPGAASRKSWAGIAFLLLPLPIQCYMDARQNCLATTYRDWFGDCTETVVRHSGAVCRIDLGGDTLVLEMFPHVAKPPGSAANFPCGCSFYEVALDQPVSR